MKRYRRALAFGVVLLAGVRMAAADELQTLQMIYSELLIQGDVLDDMDGELYLIRREVEGTVGSVGGLGLGAMSLRSRDMWWAMVGRDGVGNVDPLAYENMQAEIDRIEDDTGAIDDGLDSLNTTANEMEALLDEIKLGVEALDLTDVEGGVADISTKLDELQVMSTTLTSIAAIQLVELQVSGQTLTAILTNQLGESAKTEDIALNTLNTANATEAIRVQAVSMATNLNDLATDYFPLLKTEFFDPFMVDIAQVLENKFGLWQDQMLLDSGLMQGHLSEMRNVQIPAMQTSLGLINAQLAGANALLGQLVASSAGMALDMDQARISLDEIEASLSVEVPPEGPYDITAESEPVAFYDEGASSASGAIDAELNNTFANEFAGWPGMPTQPSVSQADTIPVWDIVIPLEDFGATMGSPWMTDLNWPIDWAFWVDFREILHPFIILFATMWGARVLWQEVRRYG